MSISTPAIRQPSAMRRWWRHPLRLAIRLIKRAARSNRFVRRLLYDEENATGFDDLYEHEKMLADTVRVETYRRAIERHVHPGDVVLDLGTGTGILAMLAARRGAWLVYAIDHSPIIAVAETLAAANGLTNIRFVCTNSRDFSPRERVDLVLHEQLGDHLFDENMVENLLDLKRRVLAPSGRMLPGRFELYLEPVALKPTARIPFLWEQSVAGLDFASLATSAAVRPYLGPRHRLRYLSPQSISHFLCDPAPILSFDLHAMDSARELTGVHAVTRPVRRGGTLCGFCLYFRAIFDEETSFDTSPLSPPTHWGTRMWRTEMRELRAGQILRYALTLPDLLDPLSWSVTLAAVETPPGEENHAGIR